MASWTGRTAVQVASCSVLTTGLVAAPAAATALGDKTATQALSQYTSANAEVKKRRYEGAANGVNARNHRNFYTGSGPTPRNRRFDGTSAPRTGTNAATCGTNKGYVYVNGTRTRTGVKWKSHLVSRLREVHLVPGRRKGDRSEHRSRSFKAYGQTNRIWHTRAQVASGAYKPRRGNVVICGWQRDGVIDHVGVITTYSVTNKAYFSVEGDSSDRLTYRNTEQTAVSTSVVDYTSPPGGPSEGEPRPNGPPVPTAGRSARHQARHRGPGPGPGCRPRSARCPSRTACGAGARASARGGR